MNIKKNKTDYEKYLAELHAKLVTPDNVLKAVIKEATNLTPVSKEKIIAGEANEVYNFSLTDKSQIIVRISRSEKPDFEQERWAISQCNQAGVPVPEILLIKHQELDSKLLSICVQRKLDGDTLERGKIDYHKLDKEYLKSILKKAGAILAKIHSVKTQNFGYLNKNGEGNFGSFTDLMSEHIQQSDEFYKIAKEINFDLKSMKTIFQILNDNLRNVPDVSPCLNHNDFGPKHIMVKGENITGILDWGEVEGHSCINDFAKWDYWFGEELPLDWLKDGYSDKNLFDENFDWMLHWIRLNNGLGVLWWYYKQNYPNAVEKAKMKLLKDLDFYRTS